MEKALQDEIQTAIELLTQYYGLVEHDQVNCKAISATATIKQRLGCLNR
jgi:hypothetical protein